MNRVQRPRRRRRIILTAMSALVLLAVAGAGAELAARSVLSTPLSALTRASAMAGGVSIGLADGLVLPQLATGRLSLSATVDSKGLTALTSCLSAAGNGAISIDGDQLVASADVTVAGRQVPLEISLQPVARAETLAFVPQSVTVAGIRLPEDQLNVLLGGSARTRFGGGIWLGGQLPRGASIQSVRVADGVMIIGFTVDTSMLAAGTLAAASLPPGHPSPCTSDQGSETN